MAEQGRQTEAFRSGVTLGIIENATRYPDRKPGRTPVESASRNSARVTLRSRRIDSHTLPMPLPHSSSA